MFPTLKIKVAGLNPKEEYDIRLINKVAKIWDEVLLKPKMIHHDFSLELKSIDNKRYRYVYHR